MKVVLATGIYPPAIGGPATYVHSLAAALTARGVAVTVITYGDAREAMAQEAWEVVRVPRSGGCFMRWRRFAQALRERAQGTDGVIAFSSVSAGVPLWFARLHAPRKVLRLGGDFFWERYTDAGGMLGLRAWYRSFHPSRLLTQGMMQRLLLYFNHLVFSSRFQEELYEKHYRHLPLHSVIENAAPAPRAIVRHSPHRPLRVLFLGRFVGFKNLPALLRAVADLRDAVTLTLVGDGPMKPRLKRMAETLDLPHQIVFVPPIHGSTRDEVFAMHDVLILPSLTELTPNVALEARAAGLPVLLSAETGLSHRLSRGMIIRDLVHPAQIREALRDIAERYEAYAAPAAEPPPQRTWDDIAGEFLALFRSPA